MTLPAAGRRRRRPPDDFSEEIIRRGQYLPCGCMMAALLLVDFLLMAARAVLRRHQRRYEKSIVLHRVRVRLLGPMAVRAVHTFLTMRTKAPVLDQADVLGRVTFDAGLTIFMARRHRGWIERL